MLLSAHANRNTNAFERVASPSLDIGDFSNLIRKAFKVFEDNLVTTTAQQILTCFACRRKTQTVSELDRIRLEVGTHNPHLSKVETPRLLLSGPLRTC